MLFSVLDKYIPTRKQHSGLSWFSVAMLLSLALFFAPTALADIIVPAPIDPVDPSDPVVPVDPIDPVDPVDPKVGTPSPSKTLILQEDTTADGLLQKCMQQWKEGARDEAVRCMQTVIEISPQSSAAYRAQTLLSFTKIQPALIGSANTATGNGGKNGSATNNAWGNQGNGGGIKPGRIEIAALSSLFGVWNGIGLTIMLAQTFSMDPSLSFLIAAASGAGLGVALGFAGFSIAENWDLSEASSRLLASSLVWGSVYGLYLIPSLSNFGSVVPMVGAVLAGGYLGAAGAGAVISLTELDTAQVSMINTGGILGTFGGILLLVNFTELASSQPLFASAFLMAGTTLGLVGGGAAGQMLQYEWGETLLCDGGMLVGGLLGGAASFAIANSTINGIDRGTARFLLTSIPFAGALGGMVGTCAAVSSWRGDRGAPVWRSDAKSDGKNEQKDDAAPKSSTDQKNQANKKQQNSALSSEAPRVTNPRSLFVGVE